MRHALASTTVGALLLLAVSGCSFYVQSGEAPKTKAPAPSTVTVSPGPFPLPETSCLVGDDCEDPGDYSGTGDGVVCAPLPAAMAAFDREAQAAIPDGDVPDAQVVAALGDLTNLVIAVVDECGYQVMVDITNQYPEPVYGWLRGTAVSALGEISALPAGKRCADLRTLGLGPKQAVDYWFYWGSPPLMDADSNGIPCETVWSDVERYMPPYY